VTLSSKLKGSGMKAILITLLVVQCASTISAQSTPLWERVYTFDDSIIEMNSSLITHGGRDITRVRFRWTFDQPETLSDQTQRRYKSQLEVLELDCSRKRYRPYEISYFDAAGNLLRKDEMNPPVDWREPAGMMQRLYAAGCDLVSRPTSPAVESPETMKLEEVAKFARSFSEQLQQTKDFNPIIQRFFASDYLSGYLEDRDTNWLLNLDRATAATTDLAELQRFYVASLNAGYLSCLYFISHSSANATAPDRKSIPPDIVEFIDQHPYTLRYKKQGGNYDYLAESIDSVDRLRSYTNLLEGIATLMRKHVVDTRAETSKEYRQMLEYWERNFALYQPKSRTCASKCFGLPKGTRLYEINVPVFDLQLAEINNELRIVAAKDNFQ